jgi:hypothetical protein
MRDTVVATAFTRDEKAMDSTLIAFWLTVVGTLCWVVCFMWMHRISTRQDGLLTELREQGRRIEDLSRMEHDLIREVHPQVGEIRDSLEAVAENVGARDA